MNPLKVAISCVGSGIGQSVVESLKLSSLPIHTLGLDCNPLAFGLYETDSFKLVPRISDLSYISTLVETCSSESIDILIPASDEELLLIAEHKHRFEAEGSKLILAPFKAIEVCRKKDLASHLPMPLSSLFVKTYSPKQAESELEGGNQELPMLAKPRSGSGSAGVRIIRSLHDLNSLDESFIVQEIACPLPEDENYEYFMAQLDAGKNSQVAEISIQLVFDRKSEIIGKMMTYNRLKNGVPVEIQFYDNPGLWDSLNPLIEYFKSLKFTGPLNIQGRLTNTGLKLFEMNARFTGISGLRAQLGFNEVEACILDLMGEKSQQLTYNPNYFGIRQTANKRVHYSINPQPNRFEDKSEMTILISGINGYLGRALVEALGEANNLRILGIVRSKVEIKTDELKGIDLYDVEDIRSGLLNFGIADCFVHCAFARPFKGAEEIRKSLDLTAELFQLAATFETRSIINISSQSVYGQSEGPWSEESIVAPESVYGLAKYSSELMLGKLCKNSSHIRFTSLRLASLCGPSEHLKPVDILSKFVNQVKSGEDLVIDSPSLMMERLDVRDAAAAIVQLISNDDKSWAPVYNLGNPKKISLEDLASTIKKIGKDDFGMNGTEVHLNALKTSNYIGMNSSKFMADTGWEPKISVEESIRDLFELDY